MIPFFRDRDYEKREPWKKVAPGVAPDPDRESQILLPALF